MYNITCLNCTLLPIDSILIYYIKSDVSNFYVGMVVEKNGRRYIAIQNVAKIISVVEALYAILTVCLD